MSEPSHVYELIIIGAGPAGITAAIYAALKKMDFIVLTTILLEVRLPMHPRWRTTRAFNLLRAKNWQQSFMNI